MKIAIGDRVRVCIRVRDESADTEHNYSRIDEVASIDWNEAGGYYDVIMKQTEKSTLNER